MSDRDFDQARKKFEEFVRVNNLHGENPHEPYNWARGMVDEGWLPLLQELVDALYTHGWDGCVSQIKEKFGMLRFYIPTESREWHQIIVQHETRSAKICEECGQPGERRSGGWIKVLCDTHHAERQKLMKP